MKKRIFALAIVLLTTVLILTLASCNEGGGETTPKTPNDNVGGDGGNNDDNNENNNDNNGGNNNENNNGNNGDGGESHVHAYGEWETVKAPTCKESGERSRSCECGEKQTEALEIVAHTESDWIVDKAATATEKGTRRKECTLCGEKLAEEEIPATGSIGLAYEKNSDNTYTITGIGTCTDTEIYIPEYIDGGKVTAIDDEAFKGNKTITSVSIPGVYYVGESAFEFCTALTEVKIGYGTEYMGAKVFSDCSALVSIELPTSLKEIPERMLWFCKKLERLVIPSGVTKIGSCAIYACYGLKSLYWPASIKEVGEHIFGQGWTNGLDELYIEDIAAFCAIDFGDDNDAGLVSATNPFSILGWWRDAKLYVGGKLITENDTLVIPNGVTRIGDRVFRSYMYNYISVPDSVVSVGTEAFTYETGAIIYARTEYNGAYYFGNEKNPYLILWKVKDASNSSYEIHPDTKIIGESAFSRCTNLLSITIPESVVSIAKNAFYGCTSLSSVTVLNPNTEIHNTAFDEPTTPDSAYTLYENAYYLGEGDNPYAILVKSKERSTVRIHPDTKKIAVEALWRTTVKPIKDYVTGETPVFIPNGVEYIGKSAFYDCDFMFNWDDRDCGLVIPDSVTYIGERAFVDIGGAYRVTVSKNVEVIGAGAFSNCIYLKEVIIPEGVKVIGDRAFYDCRDLESLIIPEGIESIGSEAFYNIGKITDLILPDSLKSIGEGAFKNWASLITVTVGKSVETIGTDAFDGCERITEIYNRSSLTIIPGTRIFGKIAEWARGVLTKEGEASGFVYQDGFILYDAGETVYVVEYVGDATEVVVPETVNGRKVENYVIGHYAFYLKSSIASIVLPKCVTKIEEYAFYNCRSLTEIVIPAGVKQIMDYTFYNCSKLYKVTLPEGMTEIGEYAFARCSKLENVIIPDSVTELGSYAFDRCTGLKSITLSKNLTTLRRYTFSGCTSLESVIVPEGVVNIEHRAFEKCTALTKIYLPATLKSIDEYTFEDAVIDVIVFAGTGDQWRSFEEWRLIDQDHTVECSDSVIYFKDGYVLHDKDDGVHVVSNYKEIYEISLPETLGGKKVEKYFIDDKAFYYEYPLKSVILPETVVSVGNYAFYGCYYVNQIYLPDGITYIGDFAFFDCKNISELILPEQLVKIGKYAFESCYGLNTVVLKNNLTIIENNAFPYLQNGFIFNGTVEQWHAINKDENWTSSEYTVICTNGTVTVTPQ